ncbi:MAG TPA: glycosyltransferase [Solirubrobacteraceae bacterium]|nr:glycosyltransferase [Solirubrobacteraceae bacterium]
MAVTFDRPEPLPTAAKADALRAARELAAPSSNLAQAARRYGDHFPPLRRQRPIRLSGLLLLGLMFIYLPWLFGHLNWGVAWLAWPFAAASALSALCLALSVFNGWHSRVTPPRLIMGLAVPEVAVIIPTWGEPLPMVLRTVLSVLEQDYAGDRMHVVVSDDAHNPDLARALEGLDVIYHEPPARHAPGRNGAAKAGNLNSALEYVLEHFPGVAHIETRDADDELGTVSFLRHTVGQLEADEGLAFVQTIKEAQVSAGDPFVNLDGQFYRSQLLSRNAANAVFPCGSGVVWRREALEEIGGFPTWNLVEDLQSGVEALRRGWRSCYLPVVGAVAQHSPEDIANVFKQRGTWAIDTVRLMVWGRLSGLTLRQRLQFYETLLFYLHSFTVLIYVPCTALACLGYLPVTASALSCLLHLMPYALAAELRLLILNQPFADRRRRQRSPLRALWRLKLMWLGLAPVYIAACCKALLGGPHRKPIYRITRKDTEVRWYWRETMPHLILALLIPVAFATSLAAGKLPSLPLLVTTGYWGIVNTAALSGFVARGWFGTTPLNAVRSVERRAPHARAPEPREHLAIPAANET